MKKPHHFFPHQPNNTLLYLLREPEFASALAYLVDYKEHKDLKVIKKEFSIEVSNSEITIAIIIYVGFQLQEYENLKSRKNVHIIHFGDSVLSMFEFENLNIKVVDKLGWLSSIISRSERDFVKRLESLKTLRIG